MSLIQPYIDDVVQALVGLLVLFVLGLLAELRGRMQRWLEARTTATQRETLHRLAAEATALAESAWGDGGGQEKLLAAIRYVSKRAEDYGIDVSPETIKAAIEKAVLDYNAKVKPAKMEGDGSA